MLILIAELLKALLTIGKFNAAMVGHTAASTNKTINPIARQYMTAKDGDPFWFLRNTGPSYSLIRAIMMVDRTITPSNVGDAVTIGMNRSRIDHVSNRNAPPIDLYRLEDPMLIKLFSPGNKTGDPGMGIKLQTMNAGLAESAANTYTNDKKLIPGSAGAKRVVLQEGQITTQSPDIEDAVNYVFGSLLAGDRTSETSRSSLATNGCIATTELCINGDASGDILGVVDKMGTGKATKPWNIPPDGDGNFYVTLGVEGSGNASAKSIFFNGSFLIEK